MPESADLLAHIRQVYQIPDQNDAGKAWLNCDRLTASGDSPSVSQPVRGVASARNRSREIPPVITACVNATSTRICTKCVDRR